MSNIVEKLQQAKSIVTEAIIEIKKNNTRTEALNERPTYPTQTTILPAGEPVPPVTGPPILSPPLPELDATENNFGPGEHIYTDVSDSTSAEFQDLVDAMNERGVHPNQERPFIPGEPYRGDVDIPGPFGEDNVTTTAIFDENGNQVGVRNETEPDHILYPGWVERTVVQDENGDYRIQTTGGGSGPMGGPNVWFDDLVWGSLDSKTLEGLPTGNGMQTGGDGPPAPEPSGGSPDDGIPDNESTDNNNGNGGNDGDESESNNIVGSQANSTVDNSNDETTTIDNSDEDDDEGDDTVTTTSPNIDDDDDEDDTVTTTSTNIDDDDDEEDDTVSNTSSDVEDDNRDEDDDEEEDEGDDTVSNTSTDVDDDEGEEDDEDDDEEEDEGDDTVSNTSTDVDDDEGEEDDEDDDEVVHS